MMKVEEYVSLSSLTTFQTGGLARFVVTAKTDSEVTEACTFVANKKLPLIPIGSGSNILASDDGMDAVFLRVAMTGITVPTYDDETVTVTVGAGKLWDAFVQYAVKKKWWGVENLSSIPGTVGASVVQNISAYGVALEEVVVSVRAYDTTTKKIVTLSKRQCAFGYRTSIFKKNPDRYIVLDVTFRLLRRAHPRLEYRDVKEYFSHRFRRPTLRAIRVAVIKIRKEKFPPLTQFGTAGSFFLNPVLPEKDAKRVQAKYPGMPLFSMPEGGVKIPLAWILDHVLHLKGERQGKAFLWEKQALVIATERGARTDDILNVMKRVQKKVFDEMHLKIIPEVRILENKKNISVKRRG